MKGFERPSPNSARASRAYTTGPDELIKAIEDAVESLPRWTLDGSNDTGVQAVRESRLFKFKDNVTVSVSSRGNGSEAIFESASRVGKGDMGQNLRNLRDLTGAIDQRLG